MVDAVIRLSLRHRVFVLAVAALLLGWGTYEALRMPVDVFPDLTAPTVTIIAEAHGMAPEDVETQISLPIESAMNGAAGVRRVRAAAGVGIGLLWVEFDWGTDVFRARQIVAEKLQLAGASLPSDVPRPVLAPISSIMGEILFVGLTSDTRSPMDLKTLADWTLRRRLLAVPGVAQVIPIGGETKQYQVLLKPERLAAYHLTTEQVIAALEATNQNVSAGFLREGGQELLIHGFGRVRTVEDIGETLLALREGQPILVRHVADVRIGPAVRRGAASLDAAPAVLLAVHKQPGVNTLELTARLDRLLDDIGRSLGSGVHLHRHIFRQADFIERAVHNVRAALRDGALLAFVVVLVFLASGRATLITVLAIPLSIVTAVLTLRAYGATLNTMTLGGLAIAVGELVDDAIVDVENVVRRLRENAALPPEGRRPIAEVVFSASSEIRGSIVFATAIVLLVFAPLFALGGVEGRLLQPLGLAYVVSLSASLVVALTVTPALCSLLLPRARTVVVPREGRVVVWLKARYQRLLDRALAWPRLVLGAALALLGAATVGLGLAGRGFLPDFNEGTLTINAVTLPGTSLAESDRLGNQIERILHRQPEVVVTARRTGRAELDEHAQDVSAAEIDVGLRMGKRSKAELLAALRRDLSLVPGTNIVIGQPISHRIDHLLSGSRAAIAVKLFGDDLGELRRLGEQARALIAPVPGVVDLTIEQQPAIPLVALRLDREAIARYGMHVRDVAEAAETAFYGKRVSLVREGAASFDLVVKHAAPDDLEAIGATLLTTPGGARVPLGALAAVQRDVGPNTISRENVQRKLVLLLNVAGRDLVGVARDVQARLATLALPPGYHTEVGGQFESAQAATRRLLALGLVVVAGIFVLLLVALRSPGDALLVMLNLPLALIGGVAGVWVAGGVLSVASLIGFITLFGIATRNGLMLVSHIHHLAAADPAAAPLDIVRRAAAERLSPILMTALAAGLALIPLALRAGAPGAEIQAPMAIVILFGLLSSTALNMIVVPSLYLRFGKHRGR
jgi:CzcA family heavy metal efflux pump